MQESEVRFDGQVAVVTGAGNGLGRSHALALAARGAAVVVNDYGPDVTGIGRSSAPADAVVAEIVAQGGRAVANYDGVHDRAGASAIIDAAIDSFGRIDILICNAGIWSIQPFEETDDAIWDRTLGVHVNGTMYTARAAWPHMRAQGYGRVIFTASSGGLYGKGGLTAYGAAKGAIYGLMRCLSLEAEEIGIKVNTLLPGAATRMISAKSASLWESRPGLADTAHVTPLVAYLASRACPVNGRAYSAGGGYFARDETMQGTGVRLPIDQPISVEQIAAHWAEIDDLTRPTGFADVMAYGARMFGLE